MMPNVSRGGRMAGLVAYLLGAGRHNEHTDQRVIAGDSVVMAWHGEETPSRESARSLARYLDEPSTVFGTTITAPITRWDEASGSHVKVGEGDAHVWHCSLSLRAGDGPLPDTTWASIAEDFVRKMGFDDSDGRAPCRWVAIHHGASTNGNDHIHIAVNLVREDGTKARTWRDWPRAQQAARELEVDYGLEVLESRQAGLGERGVKPGELERAAREGRPETQRRSLERRVRACVAAAGDEGEFVRRARRAGLLVRPRYAAGTTDVVSGYSVAERPADGTRPVWFGGGQLARDLTLPRLRAEWPDSPEAASVAAAEWTAAARGQRPVAPGAESTTSDPAAWQQYAAEAAALRERLRAIAPDDLATWTSVAKQAAGALAAWSVQVEASPGPLAEAAAVLGRSAHVRAWRVREAVVPRPGLRGAARIFTAAAAGGSSKTAHAVLLRQVLNTMRALHDAHRALGHAQQAAAIERAVRMQLADVARQLPPVPAQYAGVGAPSATRTAPSSQRPAAPIPTPLTPPAKPAHRGPPAGGIER
ncbi:MAG: hypothetical protein BGO26_00275 [Actinobacteria bacterium 69-20]|jgi:hypothetical protein|nr:MAG: hypothetical protein BGO26_00275 [Actinobacteria bacterium 69-20]